jgi:copper chaperone CopZ
MLEVHLLMVLPHPAIPVIHLYEHQELTLSAAPRQFRAVHLDVHAGNQALVSGKAGLGQTRSPPHMRLVALGEPLLEGNLAENRVRRAFRHRLNPYNRRRGGKSNEQQQIREACHWRKKDSIPLAVCALISRIWHPEQPEVHHQSMPKSRLELTVEGMTCQGCVRSIEKKLSSVAGVESARVDLGTGKATIEYDDSRAQVDRLIAVVEQIGYHASRT